jgi:hypothetical protein
MAACDKWLVVQFVIGPFKGCIYNANKKTRNNLILIAFSYFSSPENPSTSTEWGN